MMEDDDRVGDALGFLRYANSKLQECIQIAQLYRKSLAKKGSTMAASDFTSAKAFVALREKLESVLEKLEYENKMVHRKEVPAKLPPLIPAKSMIAPEPFELPPISTAWHACAFSEGKVYLQGENDAADKAASANDKAKIREGRHIVRLYNADDFCTIS